jgi:hypothetical protein
VTVALVTLDQVRLRLKYDAPDDDANLLGTIYGASRMVLNYLRLTEDAFTNSDGTMDVDSDTQAYHEVPEEVQMATLMMIGILLRDPEGTESQKWEPGFLPAPVTAMLYPLRDPALA